MITRHGIRRHALIGLLFVALFGGPAAAAYRPDEATVRLMNHAVGLMEQYRFTEAATAFEEVVRRAPDWPVAYVNLGIAYLNAVSDPGKPGNALDRAAEAFRRAVALDANLPQPHYCLGLVARYQGDSDAALAHFERVLEIDPQSADSLYFIGTVYLSRGEPERAEGYFEQAISFNPYLLSAHYSLAQALIRMGKKDAAMARLEVFQRLDAAKVGVKRAIVYTEMGEYADVIRVFPPATDMPIAPSIPVRFAEADVGLKFAEADYERGEPGIGFALADIDGDGDLDLFAPSRILSIHTNRVGDFIYRFADDLIYENEDGRFVDRSVLPEQGVIEGAIGGVFGDYDNDGDPDLFVLTLDRGVLLRNDGDAGFADVTSEAGLGESTRGTLDAAWVDADHEGDLDLLLARREGATLLRNNGDGTFLDITQEAGLATPMKELAGIALADFDEDADVDFLLTSTEGPPQLFLNDRLNRWSRATSRSGILQEPGGSAVLTADFDKDGDSDVLVLRGEGRPARFYRNRGDATFEPYGWAERLAARSGAILDFDNDGDLDLFFPTGRWGDSPNARPILLANDGTGRFRDVSDDVGLGGLAIPKAGAVAAADFDDDGDTDLLIARRDEPPIFLRNDGGNRNRWLQIDLRGALANRSGYGAKVEVKAGSLWQKIEHHMTGGALIASNPRIEIGLGALPTADFVRIMWPDAVLQSELEVATNQRRTIEEVQRKASSCPILFAWNGERFVFVTDFMGVGGLGFFVAPNEPSTPDPTERIRIDPDQIAPRDGEYVFQIMEPFEEISYVDAVNLLVVDHPQGTEVYPDERFALDGNLPGDRLYAVASRVYPRTATDENGRDVREALVRRDRRYPPIERDPRYIGYLKGEHALTLDFGDGLAQLDRSRPWVLYLYGWIEYPYSHVVYAAQQAGIEAEPISIDVRREDGSWETVLPNVGYPAGMPKMMTVDVSRVLSPTRTAIRLRTNLEIYLDDVFVAEDVSGDAVRQIEIPASRASLHFKGYPREFSPDGRLPRLYDYTSIDPTYAFRNMRGRYTRFGDVRDLLAAPDDRTVVMGRGEELTVAFDADALPPIPDGYTRTFILDTNGFSKDMDLYTAYPDTVEPLPFQAMSVYPYPDTESYPDSPAIREYRATYQTREK